MSEKSEHLPGRVNARRRLLRGVFAAPVVLPLHSGAQTAVASNQRCIQRQVANPSYPTAVPSVPQGDTWVRLQLYTLSGTVNNTLVIDSTWIKGDEVVTLANAHGVSSYLSANQWQCFTAPSSTQYTVGTKVTNTPSRSGFSMQKNGSWVAVRVDANGNIIGVVSVDGTAGSAITNSCWTSFKPLR